MTSSCIFPQKSLISAAVMAIGIGAAILLKRFFDRKISDALGDGIMQGMRLGEKNGYERGFAEGSAKGCEVGEEEVKRNMVLECTRLEDAFGVLSSFISQEDWDSAGEAIVLIGDKWDAPKVNVDIQFHFADCDNLRLLPPSISCIVRDLDVDSTYFAFPFLRS